MRKVSLLSVIVVSCISGFVLIFSSCEKENQVIKAQQSTNPDQVVSTTKPMLKAATVSAIVSAATANDIPTQTFIVATKYRNAYVHFQQGSGECSWTSYMITAGMVSNGNGISYNVNRTQLNLIKNGCINGCSGVAGCDPSNLYRIYLYALSKDKSSVSVRFNSTPNNSSANRFSTVKLMLDHLNNGYPLTAVKTYYQNGVKYGHYVVVISIAWKQGGAGSIIYYRDPLLPNGNTQTQDFSEFLNSMVDYPTGYNILMVGSKI